MTRNDPTGNRDAPTFSGLWSRARTMTGSPLLYVGAVTLVGAHELVDLLSLPDTYAALALFPVTLALLYGQLLLLAYYEQKGYRRGCDDA